MTPAELVPVLSFLSAAAAVAALMALPDSYRDRVGRRVRRLSGAEPRPEEGAVGRLVRGAVARVVAPLFPAGGRQERLRVRLTHAGFYGPQAVVMFQAVRLVLALVPAVAAGATLAAGAVDLRTGAASAALLAAVGMVVPGFWLDSRKARRQNDLRRGLPDFFDVLVLCVEGGMALPAAWRRVTDELEPAYPALWREIRLVGLEAEVGRPVGQAIGAFADRTDLDEVASLAAVVGQAERLGTELARPLRSLSDTLRTKRVQKAEEAAHKTATKILFPTLLLIFPGVFAIILGPMIIQVMTMFSGAPK